MRMSCIAQRAKGGADCAQSSGHVKLSVLNYAGRLELRDREVEARSQDPHNKLSLARALASEIHPFKTF